MPRRNVNNMKKIKEGEDIERRKEGRKVGGIG